MVRWLFVSLHFVWHAVFGLFLKFRIFVSSCWPVGFAKERTPNISPNGDLALCSYLLTQKL